MIEGTSIEVRGKLVFSSCGTQVISLGSKHLCLLSHLAGPILQSLKVQASLPCHESCFIHSESWVNSKVKFIFYWGFDFL